MKFIQEQKKNYQFKGLKVWVNDPEEPGKTLNPDNRQCLESVY